MRHQPYINVTLKRSFAPWMKKKNSTITFSSSHKMYQDKMAMISAFGQLVILLVIVTAEVTSAVNSILPVVHTVSNVTLISGREGTLTCYYNRTVYAVYWKYENTTSPRELLVALDKYFDVGKRSGLGYDKGRFNMTDEYSLIIHDVHATDEGRYICEVSDFETGSLFRSHTDVITVVTAKRPFIRIGQCEDDVSADKTNEPCVLHTTLDDPSIELTCRVLGAKPMVDLTWESSLSAEHWKQVMNKSTLSTRVRGNRVFDQTLTVIVDTSYIKSKKQHFTCVGKGLAVDGMANYTIAVYPAQVGSYGTRTVVISVVCTLIFISVIIGVLWTWWRVRDKRRRQKAQTNGHWERGAHGQSSETERNITCEPTTEADVEENESLLNTNAQTNGNCERGAHGQSSETEGDITCEPTTEADVEENESLLNTKVEPNGTNGNCERGAHGQSSETKGNITCEPTTGADVEENESLLNTNAETNGTNGNCERGAHGLSSETKGNITCEPTNEADVEENESLLNTNGTETPTDEEKIRKIKEFIPKTSMGSQKDYNLFHLRVFGESDEGMSSFIASLHFAVKGRQAGQEIDETSSETQTITRLTDHIWITKRIIEMTDASKVDDLFSEIEGENIDFQDSCLILVCNSSSIVRPISLQLPLNDSFCSYLRTFAAHSKRKCGRHIMLAALTKKDVKEDNFDKFKKKELSEKTEIPLARLWSWNRGGERTNAKDSMALDFLLNCLELTV